MYKSLNEVESVIALGKPIAVVDMFLESYLQGLEYDKWRELEVVEDYVPVDVSAEMTQWKKQNYAILRKSAYPPISEFVDAHVKGDTVALQAYVDKCLAVKAEYPK